MMSKISVVMGSKSDWPTVKEACKILDQFGVDYDKNVISAHRMPNEMFAFAQGAVKKGTKVIIACAGGAAHLPGMIAANTPLPVIGIPGQTKALGGWTRCCQSSKCQREFPLPPQQSGLRALKTQHC